MRFTIASVSFWPLLLLTAAWLTLLYLTTGGGNLETWVPGWARWDAHHYLSIWRDGYSTDPVRLAFPPGYPWLTGGLAALSGLPFFTVGSSVSLISLLIAGVALCKLAQRDFGVPGTWVFAFWLCSPAMYFAVAPYSDLLFCALLFPVLYWLTAARLSRTEQIMLLALLAVLPLVRITALGLLVLLLLRRWQVLAMLPGLALFIWLNHHIGGDPLHFVNVQSKFLMPDGDLLAGLHRAWDGLHPIPPVEKSVEFLHWLQFNAVPLTQGGALIATGLWLIWRRQGVLALTLLAIVLMSHNQGFWRSVVRYDLVLWPMVALPLLAATKNRFDHWRASDRSFPLAGASCMALLGGLMMLGLLLQWRFAAVFHRGGWGF